MAKYKVEVGYAFEGTYTITAGNRREAKRMVGEDCGLILGGNIHAIHDDDKVMGWNLGIHPESQILSVREMGRKARTKYIATDFNDRVKELRNDITETIRQLLQAHSLAELVFTSREDGPAWVIWFEKNGDPYEHRVTSAQMMEGNLTVATKEGESGDEAECYGSFELGTRSMDQFHEAYDAAWR